MDILPCCSKINIFIFSPEKKFKNKMAEFIKINILLFISKYTDNMFSSGVTSGKFSPRPRVSVSSPVKQRA